MARHGLWLFAILTAWSAVSCTSRGDGGNPTSPGPPAPGSTIIYTAIGASDATGHGASIECLPYADCPDGLGYVQVVARRLQSSGHAVTLRNLGMPTAVISRSFQTLAQQYGRFIAGNFIDNEMPFVPSNATTVTIFAGGNEVNSITSALGGGAGASDPAAFIDQQVAAFRADYGTLVNGIRNSASGARIVALNVPNLAGLPYLVGASLQQRQAAQRAAVAMTTSAVNGLVAQNVTVVDLMCDARSYLASNYSSDGFHPNDAGYAFIADEVYLAVTSSSYPAPRASCSQMTIVR